MNDVDKTIVIASTYAQFLLWLDELKDQSTRLQYIFVSNEEDLLQYSFDTPIVVLNPILDEVRYMKAYSLRMTARARFTNITYERT